MIPKTDCDAPPGKRVTRLEIDLTEKCMLACPYCYRFKGGQQRGAGNESMSWDVAKRAIDWLVEEAQDSKDIGFWFLGGEPLMEFDLIKQFTEYAEVAAKKANKPLRLGVTTNLVLVNDRVIDFFRAHKIRFNTSIDGAPATQDRWRIFPDGSGTSRVVVSKVRPILDYLPNTTARSTLDPEGVGNMFENVKYLIGLGYVHLAMMPVMEKEWTEEQYSTYAAELHKVGDFFIACYRRGRPFYFKQLNNALKGIALPRRRVNACGAGRALLCVDRQGRLWPCHRFPGYDPEGTSVLGDIWNGLDDEKRRVYLELDCRYDVKGNCEQCIAVHACGVSCPATNYYLWRDISRPAPVHCRISEIAFREALRIHFVLTREENRAFLKDFYGDGRGERSKARPTVRRTRQTRRLPRLTCAV